MSASEETLPVRASMSSQRQGVHGLRLGAAANGEIRMAHEWRAPPATALAVLHPPGRQRHTATPCHSRHSVLPAVHNVDSSR